jgi:predicted porin
MKKLPLILALSAASVCTFANAQSVQVYGKLYPYLEIESGSGQTPAGTSAATLAPNPTGLVGVPKVRGMSAGNTYIGFRGREDLGGGMRAVYQLEGVVLVDNGAQAGFFFNRNTFVGVDGTFGSVKLGTMDTVFKEYGDTLGILGISSGTPVSSSNILRKVSFGTSNTARFHERRANSVRYDSPEVGGFQAAAQWATQENPTALIGPAKTLSLGVKYDQGPFYASLAWEKHDNFFGGSVNSPSAMRNNGATDGISSKDTAVQATFEWRIVKGQTVEFDWIQKKYKEGAVVNGRFQSYKNNAYMVAYDGRFDLWRVMAHYVKSDAGSCTRLNAVCNTTGLEGTQLTAGVAYYLSRRTFLYGAYSQIRNGTTARFAAADFGAPTPGEDVRHIMSGISHNF